MLAKAPDRKDGFSKKYLPWGENAVGRKDLICTREISASYEQTEVYVLEKETCLLVNGSVQA